MNRRQRKAARRLNGSAAGLSLFERLAVLGPCPTYDAVHTVEQAAPVARARVEWQRTRAAILAQHAKRSRLSDPDLLQELHSPTVEIATDDPEATRKTRRNVTRVRQSEAWRHNALTAMQRQAESEMQTAWKLRTQGLGVTSSNIGAIAIGASASESNTTGGDAERFADLESTWREFVRETQRERIPFGLVLRVLTEPRTLAEIESAFRLRQGVAMFEYVRGLDLWCVLRGWIRPAR